MRVAGILEYRQYLPALRSRFCARVSRQISLKVVDQASSSNTGNSRKWTLLPHLVVSSVFVCQAICPFVTTVAVCLVCNSRSHTQKMDLALSLQPCARSVIYPNLPLDWLCHRHCQPLSSLLQNAYWTGALPSRPPPRSRFQASGRITIWIIILSLSSWTEKGNRRSAQLRRPVQASSAPLLMSANVRNANRRFSVTILSFKNLVPNTSFDHLASKEPQPSQT